MCIMLRDCCNSEKLVPAMREFSLGLLIILFYFRESSVLGMRALRMRVGNLLRSCLRISIMFQRIGFNR